MNRSEWTAGDDNVVRLLGQPYDPPSVPAEFAQRVQARMLEVAAEMARQRAHAKRLRRSRNRLPALAGVAAMLGILALGLHFLPRPVVPSFSSPPSMSDRQLVAAPALAVPPTPSLAPGERIVTRRGERRRVALSDGSVLSLNENTAVRHDAARHLLLDAGEIFVEVAPRRAGKTAALFTVATPHREVRAVGTKFLVHADAEGTGVAVTQGQVHVNNVGQAFQPDGPSRQAGKPDLRGGLLSAGQQLAPKADAVTPTPRLSYLLDWTRDLVAAATPPLVPPSPHSGGALVAVDPQGHAANLSLRKYHIDVHIEDGFARTTIDQTYFNHTRGRLEGTFFFPLPADASLSRLAMYVDGQLMEGGMVERDYGRMVFDQIVTKRKDPALLEWVDGHTFKMRVFPLEPRQEKRIILSYTQRLPSLYGRWSYRFPAGHSLGAVRDWSFHARVKDGKNMIWHCASHTLTPRIEQGDLLLDASVHQAAMDHDLALTLVGQAFQPDGKDSQAFQPDGKDSQAGKPDLQNDAVRFSTATQDGHRYLMLRYRPTLPGSAKRQRRDWVFLFESSAERDPLLARTQVEIVRTLLANAEHDDTFAILTAGTQVHAFASPLRATPENVTAAVAFLEKSHLLGALDLDAGLTAAAGLLNNSEHPVLVHLGCGQAVLGERRADVLADRIPRQACYVGVGVGKRGASEFMRRAAERCQGYVSEINPDEPVAWRAFDLFSTLNTPRLMNVRVAGIDGKTRLLCPTSTVAQGEELCAITRLPADAPLPSSVCVTGTLDGSPFHENLRVHSPRHDAAYLPRTWARLEIDRLLAEDAVKNKDAIIALSKAMYVMTPYTSLLVLENEAMYAQYRVDRGRKDHWAMYPCPAKVPVIYEPLPIQQAKLIRQEAIRSSLETRRTMIEEAEWERAHMLDFFMWEELVWSERMMRPGRQYVTVSQAEADEARQRGTQWMMNPYQGYLTGSADIHPSPYLIQLEVPPITRAAISVESEAQLKERIRRENRGHKNLERIIEEAEWERARMPDPEKIRQKELDRELVRSRANPPMTDIWSARSLNALLHHLIARQKQGVRGPNVPLSEDILTHIHLTVGAGRGGLGLLKNSGYLQWPLALYKGEFKEAREGLSALMQTAVKRAKVGTKPDSSTLSDLQAHYEQLKNTLNANVDRLSPDEYIEANRYLHDVKDAITALKDPNVATSLNKNFRLKAKNVAELVSFMREKGLSFAPATYRDRVAYIALYQALAAFDAGQPQPTAPGKPLAGCSTLAGYDTFAADNLNPEWAEQRLAALLADPEQTKRSSLWRHAARFAERRKQYDVALRRLRRALELEKNRSGDLLSLRRDFDWFLSLSEQRVRDLIAQHRSVPRELLDGVMAIADQWRAVDLMDVEPCGRAGSILRQAGERELAWSYVTSPAVLQRGSAADWLELALRQHGQEDYDLAERALVVAAALEPGNAEIIWERALNHRTAGRRDAARTLLRQLDKGTWAEKYREFQLRAHRALEEERD